MSKLYLYYDMLSQPSRTLYTFLKVTGIPFVPCKTVIINGDNKTQEFAKINPRKKLPAFKDGDFCLSESVAIFRYIAEKYQHKIADHWYPRDLKKRARVDEYLEYQHNGTRLHYSYLFQYEAMPMMTGETPDKKQTEKLELNMKKITHIVQKTFLGDQRYLCGDQISIADIFAAHEILQIAMVGYEPLEGFPKMSVWLERVSQELNPPFVETIEELYSVAGKEVPQKYQRMP
ncbi:Glutathione S-transferase theta-3 [Holothuria leucospilota]|uniref:Glutathione S-transferase theta-3 n=1 Tax=Holothuria leucospilota TaxID=206669 RepID=A0A9Q1CEH9_HOLLE|nr:Glutathione S-transferase theta-3 [Holothuria leucospilota]